MQEFNFKIQRFEPGHPLYTDVAIVHPDPKSPHADKPFQATFGQCVDSNGKFLHYTLERRDTLITEDTYDYDLYFSPANKTIVPRLIRDSAGNDISFRELEHHIANWPWELLGCTAHGKGIITKTLTLVDSHTAFHELMALIGSAKGGKITYETLK